MMPLRLRRFERAVEALLLPRHYEFLLFLQDQIAKDGILLGVRKKETCRKVIRIIEAEKAVGGTIGSVDEAGQVLEEALRRLK